MSNPPCAEDYLLARSLKIDPQDQSDVYPALLLYGCGCWALLILISIAVWLVW